VSAWDPSNLEAAGEALIAAATEVGIASQGFSLHRGTYREGYDKLHTLYLQVNAARLEVEHRAAAVHPEAVSLLITGIHDGATLVHRSVGGVGTGSLRDALLTVENQLADVLTKMYKSYVTYRRTDQESAFNLFGAAETP